MTLLERLGTTGPAFGAVVVSTVGVHALVVLLTRVAGPRSLATTSSVDSVVLETSGETSSELSVLTGDRPLDPAALAGVRGAELLP